MHTNRICAAGLTALAFATGACGGEDVANPPPETPTVNDIDVACATPAVISGTKQSSTSIQINGTEAVPLDEETTWMASVPLMEGQQPVRIVAVSATDARSTRIELQVTLDLTAPSAPVVEMTPLVAVETTYTLTGTKDANTAILIDGVEEVAANAEETWSVTVTLREGQNNIFNISASDQCRESEIVTVEIFQDVSGIGLQVDEVMSPTCMDTAEITGVRAPGVAILLGDMEVVPAGESTGWSVPVMLVEGENTFLFKGSFGGEESIERMVVIEYDATPPAPPVVSMAPTFTCEAEITLTGTKDANSGILLDGNSVVPNEDATTAFSFTHTLSQGVNNLQIDSEDFCSRTSGAPTVLSITLDTVAPTVMITSPMAGATVTGVAAIEGEGMDNAQLASVEITVDGAVLANVTTTSTFTAAWNTAAVSDGQHLISATAIDRAGKRSTPVSIMVDVSNNARVVTGTEPIPPPSVENGPPDPALADSVRPSLAALTNQDVALAWRDNIPELESRNDEDIFLRVFRNGTVAQPTVVVSDHRDDGRSENPRLSAAPNGGIHIVWQENGDIDGDGGGAASDFDVIYRSYQGGALGNAFLVVSSVDDGRSQFPDVATDPMGNAHVVWQDDGDLDGDGDNDRDIYYAMGGPNGFNAPVLISDAPMDGESVLPRIAVAPNGCPHIVWQDTGDIDSADSDGQVDIYYRGSSLIGAGCTFGPIILISEEQLFERTIKARIAADPMNQTGLLWITFEGEGDVVGNGNDRDVYLRNVFDNAAGALLLISEGANDGESREGSVVVDANTNVHVMWADSGNIANSGPDFDTFIRTWNGQLSAIEPISDAGGNAVNTEDSLSPDMATNGTSLYLTWDDRSDFDGDGVPDADILYLIRN